jgi:subtilase family serine protease
MGAIKPWHVLSLLCCLVVIAAIAGAVVFAVARSRKSR